MADVQINVSIFRMLVVVVLILPHSSFAQTCSYDTWRWNVHSKQIVQQERIVRSYAAIRSDERDKASGCTVCEEDQVKIDISGLPVFYVCKLIAPQVRHAFAQLQERGTPIKSIIAYRVGRSRGKVDASGNRSEFSNHSFGVALDINSEHNGLYNRCTTFGPLCVLSRGGVWLPGNDPLSISRDSGIVRLLKAAGLKWGGEIAGQQKDFMHFSPSGY